MDGTQLLSRLFRPAACGGGGCGARFSSTGSGMERAGLLTPFPPRAQATARVCVVSSFATELLQIRSREPSSSVHVLVIPGNPGIVGFYKDFVESLYENLGGQASITAIGHISHGQKDYERGRLFSLREQIDHKVDFLEQELLNTKQSIILVGHSIGAYIGLEIFKRLQKRVNFFVGLYPFLSLDKNSTKQTTIGYIARSSLLSKGVSLLAFFIGSFKPSVTRSVVRRFLGSSWSASAVDAASSHLLKYHTMQNVLFMAKTEFLKVNFMAATKSSLRNTLFFAEFFGTYQYHHDRSKISICCPLDMGRCCYGRESECKIMYPDHSVDYFSRDITHDGLDAIQDTLETDFLYFDSERDVKLAKELQRMSKQHEFMPISDWAFEHPAC